MATTTPDAIYWPSDYNLPADVPNDTQKMAASVQTALNNVHTAVNTKPAPGAISGTHEIAPWQGYTVVTSVDPTWQPIGSWLQVNAVNTAGYFRILLSGYLNPTGGTAAGLGVMFGIRAQWGTGATFAWANGRQAALGRATAPAGATLNASGVAEGWAINVPGAPLRIIPEATKLTNPAGGSARVGEFRATITFHPGLTVLGATVLP